MFYSCMDLLQPAVTHHEKFKLCKSVLEDGEIWGEVREGMIEQRECEEGEWEESWKRVKIESKEEKEEVIRWREEKKKNRRKAMYICTIIYVQVQVRFTCICVAKEEEDDEAEEKEDEREDQPDLHNKENVATGPSRIAVSLSVGKGLLSLHLPVKVLPQLTYIK